MENRIETLEPTTILGKSMEMSLARDKTQELWKSFGPLISTIKNRKDRNFISLQKFIPPFDPNNFDPNAPFTKWAGVALESVNSDEVHRYQDHGLELYNIPGGLYAVFKHVGPAAAFLKSMKFIYGKWFPDSGYRLDDREHFEVIPEGYRPDDPDAEEEIWIPVREA